MYTNADSQAQAQPYQDRYDSSRGRGRGGRYGSRKRSHVI